MEQKDKAGPPNDGLAPDGNENPRLDIPWHAATLIEHDKDRGGEKEEENRASFPQFWKEKKDDI